MTLLFLGACAALFVVAERYDSTEDVETLLQFGATHRAAVWSREVWRLVASAFLHIGVGHLTWNIVTMLGWCVPLERALGSARFSAIYLGAAIAASGLSVVIHDGVSAGASGAGYGVVGAHLALATRRTPTWAAFFRSRSTWKHAGVALVWMAISAATANGDVAGHVGGFAAGIALARALSMPADATTGPCRLAWCVAVLAVAAPVALASFPTRWTALGATATLEAEVFTAVERRELDAADRALDSAARMGFTSPKLAYERAFLTELRGDNDGAAKAYETMTRSSDPETRRLGSWAGKALLGIRLWKGYGMEADPVRGRTMLEELCSAGSAETCRLLQGDGETKVMSK
jgi:rhomboid protease GluP